MTKEQIERQKAARKPDQNFRSVICLDDGMIFDSIKSAAAKTGASGKQISAVCAGHWITAGGYHFAYYDAEIGADQRQRMIDDLEQRRTNALGRIRVSRSKAVICINNGQRYDSGAEAARQLGLSVMRVSQMCRNGSMTKHGLRFQFCGQNGWPDYREKTAEELADSRRRHIDGVMKANMKTSKAVVCLDNNKLFKSISAAAREYKLHVSAVSAAIYRNGSAGGQRFAFYNQMDTK